MFISAFLYMYSMFRNLFSIKIESEAYIIHKSMGFFPLHWDIWTFFKATNQSSLGKTASFHIFHVQSFLINLPLHACHISFVDLHLSGPHRLDLSLKIAHVLLHHPGNVENQITLMHKWNFTVASPNFLWMFIHPFDSNYHSSFDKKNERDSLKHLQRLSEKV